MPACARTPACAAVQNPANRSWGRRPPPAALQPARRWPLAIATCSGVVPVRSGRSPSGSLGLVLTLTTSLTSAPAFISALTRGNALLAHGKQQRRKTRVERRRKSAPASMSASMTCDVAFGRRPHERRLSAPRFLGVHIGAAREQHTHRIHLARARGRHQHGFAAGQHRVRVGAGIEKSRDDGGVAVHARERQRRHAIAVRGGGVRAGRQQPVHEIEIVVIGGPVQRGRAVRLGRVDVDASRVE